MWGMSTRLTTLALSIGGAFAALTGLAGVATAAPPTIERQWVSGVTSSNAILNAEIDPSGLETHYMLQIDLTGNFKFDQNDACILHPPSIGCAQVLVPGDPLPPGLVPPTELVLLPDSGHHVSVSMDDIGAILQPGTTYHYRAIAANDMPFIEGLDQTFTTPPATAPPTIDRQWVTDVTASNATLHAEINPNGLETHYELQIDTTGSFSFFQEDSCPLHPPGIACAAGVIPGDPLPPGLVQPLELTVPAGHDSQQVSVALGSIGATLEPETIYRYRTIAANGAVLREGPAQAFTTSAGISPNPPEQQPEAPPWSWDSFANPPGLLAQSGDLAGSTDTSLPDTSIVRAKIRPHAGFARFISQSTEVGSGFWCRLDDHLSYRCASPQTYRRLGNGRHVFRVAAVDASGNVDPSPALWRFGIAKPSVRD